MGLSKFSRRAQRAAGTLLLLDGIGGLLFGRKYAEFWEIGPEDSAYGRAIRWVAALPPWQIRLASIVEAGIGLALVGSAPLAVPELYRAIARPYRKIETRWRDWLYVEAHRSLDRDMVSHLPPDGRVLDLGCGTGANLARLLALGQPFGSYTGVDLSEAMLEQARPKAEGRDDVRFLQLDVEQDALPEGPFDLIVATWAFEHFRDPVAVVTRAWERLRPGGHVVLLSLYETTYWWNRVSYPVLRFFGDTVLPEEDYRVFPGLADMELYRGPFGEAALITLHKPRGSARQREEISGEA